MSTTPGQEPPGSTLDDRPLFIENAVQAAGRPGQGGASRRQYPGLRTGLPPATVAYGSLGTMIHMARYSTRPEPPRAATHAGQLKVGLAAVQLAGWVHGAAFREAYLHPGRPCPRAYLLSRPQELPGAGMPSMQPAESSCSAGIAAALAAAHGRKGMAWTSPPIRWPASWRSRR